MEFMPHEDMVKTVDAPPVTAATTQVVEEEVAGVEIGDQNNQQCQQNQQRPIVPQPLTAEFLPQPPQEKPIYFSDGVMYASELNQPSTSSEEPSNTDGTVALPNNLLEIYDNLGLIGKLLTGGSLVTIKLIQTFRTFGESIVDILGITKPKYEYEINLHKQMQEQEQQRQQKLDQLYSSWQQPLPPPPATGVPPLQVPGPSMAPSTSSAVNMQSNIIPMDNSNIPVQYQSQLPPPTMMPSMVSSPVVVAPQVAPMQLPPSSSPTADNHQPPFDHQTVPQTIPTMQPPQVSLPYQATPPGPLMPPMTNTTPIHSPQ